MTIYTQIATTFSDLHDTPGRMKAKGCIREIIKWSNSRQFFFYRIRRRLEEDRLKAKVREITENVKEEILNKQIQSAFEKQTQQPQPQQQTQQTQQQTQTQQPNPKNQNNSNKKKNKNKTTTPKQSQSPKSQPPNKNGNTTKTTPTPSTTTTTTTPSTTTTTTTTTSNASNEMNGLNQNNWEDDRAVLEWMLSLDEQKMSQLVARISQQHIPSSVDQAVTSLINAISQSKLNSSQKQQILNRLRLNPN